MMILLSVPLSILYLPLYVIACLRQAVPLTKKTAQRPPNIFSIAQEKPICPSAFYKIFM